MKKYNLIVLCLFITIGMQAQKAVELTTSKKIQQGYWSLSLAANGADASNVWVDWNNNGKKDSDETIENLSWGVSHPITSQTITVYGKLTKLAVTRMDITKIEFFDVSAILELDISNNRITALTLNNVPLLRKIKATNNKGLHVFNTNHLPLLEEFKASNCSFQALDFSNAPRLQILDISSNEKLNLLDITTCQNITTIDVSKCSLSQLQIGEQNKIKSLRCNENKLTNLDLSTATLLQELWCFSNNLSTLILPHTQTLIEAKFYNNQIRGTAMSKLVEGLAHNTNNDATLYAINLEDGSLEKNQFWKKDVTLAKNKGWKVLARLNRFQDKDYAGSDQADAPSDLFTTDLPTIELTSNTPNNPLILNINTNNIDASAIWADLNNNGHYDNGEEIKTLGTTTQLSYNGNKLIIYGKIMTLDCSNNKLEQIKVGKGSILSTLKCHNNLITELNLSNVTQLNQLYCYNNKITAKAFSRTVSQLPFRKDETVEGRIVAVNIEDKKEQNKVNNDIVKQANAQGWEVYSINNNGDTSPYKDETDPTSNEGYTTQSDFVLLTKLNNSLPWKITLTPNNNIVHKVWIDLNNDGICQEGEKWVKFEEECQLPVVALSVKLYGDYTALKCSENHLSALDITNHTSLKKLDCSDNGIGDINLTKASTLQQLFANNNKLTKIDLSKCEKLERLNVAKNPLHTILWPTNKGLHYIDIYNLSGNSFPNKLNLSEFLSLEEIHCGLNNLEQLVLPKTKTLKEINCYANKLETLELNGIDNLEGIVCDQNLLTSLDLKDKHNIEYVSLYSNRISLEEMARIVEQLPARSENDELGLLYAIDSEDYADENTITATSVQLAKNKHWQVFDNKGRKNSGNNPYEGLNIEDEITDTNAWDGNIYSWTKGNGTVNNPYLIETPQHLAYLAQQVNNGKDFTGIYFRQVNNINMGAKQLGKSKGNFIPIGFFDAGYITDNNGKEVFKDDSKRFNGHYDGYNNSISNLYQQYDNEKNKTVGGHGLFGCIGPKGCIENLYLGKTCLFEGGFEGGSIASYLEGTISNCGSHATVKGTSIIGGLVAVLRGGTIKQSFFAGLCEGTLNVGGLAGYIGTAEEGEKTAPKVMDCYVNANIKSLYSYVGMALGFIAEKPELKRIYVTGALTGKVATSMKGAFVGAIDGALVPEMNKLNIENCFFDSDRINIQKSSSDGDIKGITAKTSVELKSDEILSLLGSCFIKAEKGDNRGYPRLRQANINSTQLNLNHNSNCKILVNNNRVTIIGKGNKDIVIVYDMGGNTILKTNSTTFTLTQRNNYIVTVCGEVFKITL